MASAAELVLKKHNNVYFLIGGKKGPLKGISHNNWIEIGWTNDPGSLINCSDFFILPNRQTFFDLVLLEVMSLSKPVLASSTGGNKKVSNLSKGVILFNPSVSDLFTAIEKLIILNKSALSDLGMKNFFSYKDNFTIDIFCENYIKTLNIISNEIEKN